jgi:hypothetical protein
VTFVGELSCGADTSLLSTTVACFNREWRTHGTTSKSLKPEPKGEGTVWQRTLIRPNRTHQKLEDTGRGRASYVSPARLGIHQNDDEPRFMLCMAGFSRALRGLAIQLLDPCTVLLPLLSLLFFEIVDQIHPPTR